MFSFVDMDPRVSRDEKEIALLRAKENGLDLVEVAKITVKLIMGKAFLVRLHVCLLFVFFDLIRSVCFKPF